MVNVTITNKSHQQQRRDEPADYPDLNVKSGTKGRAGKR